MKIVKNLENIVFLSVIILIAGISVLKGDKPVATISSLCGLSYSILAGKGKFYCYFVGMAGTLCYSYLAFKNTLYGNCALYLMYYFPMEIAGVINWRKNTDKTHKTVVKTELKKALHVKNIIAAAIISLLTGFVMKYTGNNSPFIDAFSTVFSIYGMYLTVKRCVQQWNIWLFVNILSFVMWLKANLYGGGVLAMVLMQLTYIFLAVYFGYKWKKEREIYS